MKYNALLYVFGCACLLITAKATLLDSLNAVHSNPAFKTLSPADQILIIELIAEVEMGEVKAYIDQVGFHHVISVIDSKYIYFLLISALLGADTISWLDGVTTHGEFSEKENS